ncbi:thioredoxin family protein [Acuticoccus mangrovi]|uniref:Thioredoxin family protein n=1 Tax=Acuticoccus mangrovi TaxID=2796142 RepID=A0A934IHE1_9HYPH|nr:thioredoxin family protein [Acuticoccus mangrovi]MBJ3776508.1 thioredoxin family protein [Acuticoccus mangrovi]
MIATDTALGLDAPDFTLPATDGRMVSLADIMMDHGAVVAFICNHCPYVVAAARRIADDARTLMGEGVGFVAICSNDASRYPADSFERMGEFATAYGFAFPYLHDEDQRVAAAYGAVVTPDFFGLDGRGRLRYRGRLDAGGSGRLPPEAPRELVDAMRTVAATGDGPARQHPPVGCSIKWRV